MIEKRNIQFPVARTAILGAVGFVIGLPIITILSFGISDQFLRWTLVDALLGGFAGLLLGLAESSRRPTLRMAVAGFVGGALSYPVSYFLYQGVNALISPNPQAGSLHNLVVVFPVFLFLAAGYGLAAGGKSCLLKFILYGLLAEVAGFVILEWMTAITGETVGGLVVFACIGAFLGWSLAREFPADANPSARQFSLRGCLPVLKVFSIICLVLLASILLLGGGIILSRIRQPASEEVAFVPPSSLPALPSMFPKIDRYPPSVFSAAGGRGALEAFPSYDPSSMDPFQMDLRGMDLSSLDLRNSLKDLQYAAFDDMTLWPPSDRMPVGFDIQKIMDLGRNPGLGIRALHANGITGRGVGIAIIDQALIADHREYAGQLRLYEEVGYSPDSPAEMHGPAVASIAVGRTVGVAPEADLYFIADTMCNAGTYESIDFACLAKSVRRIIEINRSLPEERKIRVLSLSIGWGANSTGYQDIMAAVRDANAAGIFVVSTSLDVTNNLNLCSLGREPLADPDAFSSYEPGLFLQKDPIRRAFILFRIIQNNCLWATMDSRTTANYSGPNDYAFYREGGMSWSVPYVAGIYALAAQVDPAITPDRFWSLALSTGRTVWNGQTLILGPIVDPQALIAAL